jgi:hypothetical protein
LRWSDIASTRLQNASDTLSNAIVADSNVLSVGGARVAKLAGIFVDVAITVIVDKIAFFLDDAWSFDDAVEALGEAR